MAQNLEQDHITRPESARTSSVADKMLIGMAEETRREMEAFPNVIKCFRSDNGKCNAKTCSVNSE